MVAPAVVQAAAAVTAPSYAGGGGYDSGGGYDDTDDTAAAYAPDQGDDDQDDGAGDDVEGLGDIDYEQALAGLGDWKGDLKNFGVSAGKTVASQALTTIGQKLGGGQAYKPPAPPPMSTATKVAIGAAIALPVGYLVLRRRPA